MKCIQSVLYFLFEINYKSILYFVFTMHCQKVSFTTLSPVTAIVMWGYTPVRITGVLVRMSVCLSICLSVCMSVCVCTVSCCSGQAEFLVRDLLTRRLFHNSAVACRYLSQPQLARCVRISCAHAITCINNVPLNQCPSYAVSKLLPSYHYCCCFINYY